MATETPGWIWPPARALDSVAREVAAQWGVALGERFGRARYSFAAPAGAHVLKVTPPEDWQADREGEALAVWGGDGAIRLVRRDATRRALLLERVAPGYDLAGAEDGQALRTAIDVARKLWRRVPDGSFTSAADEIARNLDDAVEELAEEGPAPPPSSACE